MSLTKGDLQAIGELMDSKLEPLNKRIDGLDKRVGKLEDTIESVRDSQLLIENKFLPKIQVALDGIMSLVEKDKEQDKRIDGLELKTEKHDTKIFKLENKLAVGE